MEAADVKEGWMDAWQTDRCRGQGAPLPPRASDVIQGILPPGSAVSGTAARLSVDSEKPSSYGMKTLRRSQTVDSRRRRVTGPFSRQSE